MRSICNSAAVFHAQAGVAGEAGRPVQAAAVKAIERAPEAAFTQESEAKNALLRMPRKWKRAPKQIAVRFRREFKYKLC